MVEEKCHKGKAPKECSPEQIKKCHGNEKKHACGKSEAKESSDK